MKTGIWRMHMDSVARGMVRDEPSERELTSEPTTLVQRNELETSMPDHSPSLMPMAVSARASEAHTVEMASFGIIADPEADARKKRGMVFAAGVAVFLAIAAIVIGRSSHDELVAKAKEVAPPPAAAAAVPAPPKEEPKPVASAPAPAPEPAKSVAEAPADKKPAVKPKKHHRAKH